MAESIYDLLNQDVYWQPKEGPPVLVESMRPNHVRNLIAWLERRAEKLKWRYELNMVFMAAGPLGPSGDMACDAFDSAMDELDQMDPQVWLSEFPLVIKLRELDAAYRAAELKTRTGPSQLPAGATARVRGVGYLVPKRLYEGMRL